MPTPPATITLTPASAPGAPSTITNSAASSPSAPSTITNSAASAPSAPSTISGGGFPPVTVAGAGTAAANGVFAYAGMLNSKPYYAKVGGTEVISYFSSSWRIETTGDASSEYSAAQNVATPDLVTSWSVGAGAGPAPTVTAGFTPSTITLTAASQPAAPGTIAP